MNTNEQQIAEKHGVPIPRDRPWWHYPNGTKAPAHGGGHWLRVTGGWKWCNGDVFPTPGGDNMDQVILPTQPAERPTPITDAFVTKWRTVEELLGHARDLERQLAEALQKIDRQAERIRYLEGATNHATGTPLAKMTEERDRLVEAIRNLRDVKGRHHTQIAAERLFDLLPENFRPVE